jgi:perosamine synthetase
VQLARIEELVARKRQIFGWYQERLRGAPVELNFERPGERNVYFMVTAILDEASGLTPIAVRDELDSYGIATRPFFIPLSALPAFADSPDTPRARRENPVCYHLSDRGLNLPSALMLTESDVDLVCERFLSLLDRAPASDRA